MLSFVNAFPPTETSRHQQTLDFWPALVLNTIMETTSEKLGGKFSIVLCAVGFAVSLVLGIWSHLPGDGGCVHGWIFSCEAVHRSSTSWFLGLPLWAWSGLWFIALAALIWRAHGRRGAFTTALVIVTGWFMVIHLRGVELFVIHAACLLCWLAGALALAAGIQPLSRSIETFAPNRRWIALGALTALWAAGFFAGALRKEAAAMPLDLPEIPEWQWVRMGNSPLMVSDLMICGPDTPTLVLIYDPSCQDCHELIAGPLSDEALALFISEHCRVAVLFDEMVSSELLEGINTTPAILLLMDGHRAAEVSGHVGEEEILALVEATYAS
jgi:uncharacterized membrane protein